MNKRSINICLKCSLLRCQQSTASLCLNDSYPLNKLISQRMGMLGGNKAAKDQRKYHHEFVNIRTESIFSTIRKFGNRFTQNLSRTPSSHRLSWPLTLDPHLWALRRRALKCGFINLHIRPCDRLIPVRWFISLQTNSQVFLLCLKETENRRGGGCFIWTTQLSVSGPFPQR